jgi:hypothetical protein
VDNPDNDDSLIGRTYNRFIFANVMIDITDKFSTGFEVTHWQTRYHNLTAFPALSPTEPGNSVTLDWMFAYGF